MARGLDQDVGVGGLERSRSVGLRSRGSTVLTEAAYARILTLDDSKWHFAKFEAGSLPHPIGVPCRRVQSPHQAATPSRYTKPLHRTVTKSLHQIATPKVYFKPLHLTATPRFRHTKPLHLTAAPNRCTEPLHQLLYQKPTCQTATPSRHTKPLHQEPGLHNDSTAAGRREYQSQDHPLGRASL